MLHCLHVWSAHTSFYTTFWCPISRVHDMSCLFAFFYLMSWAHVLLYVVLHRRAVIQCTAFWLRVLSVCVLLHWFPSLWFNVFWCPAWMSGCTMFCDTNVMSYDALCIWCSAISHCLALCSVAPMSWPWKRPGPQPTLTNAPTILGRMNNVSLQALYKWLRCPIHHDTPTTACYDEMDPVKYYTITTNVLYLDPMALHF